MLKTFKIINENTLVICKNLNNHKFILPSFIKIKILKKFIKFFVNTFYGFYFRIIWKGKAYRVRYFKKNNKFTFNFGHSHWCKLLFFINLFNFFKIKKQNYVIFFKYRKNLKYVEHFFNNIREFNKYTRRGVRVKNVPTSRRFGKISQVNSSLNNFN